MFYVLSWSWFKLMFNNCFYDKNNLDKNIYILNEIIRMRKEYIYKFFWIWYKIML